MNCEMFDQVNYGLIFWSLLVQFTKLQWLVKHEYLFYGAAMMGWFLPEWHWKFLKDYQVVPGSGSKRKREDGIMPSPVAITILEVCKWITDLVTTEVLTVLLFAPSVFRLDRTSCSCCLVSSNSASKFLLVSSKLVLVALSFSADSTSCHSVTHTYHGGLI